MSAAGPPPADAIQIGPDQYIAFAEYKGEQSGIHEYHKNPAGEWCAGWVAFKGSPWDKQFSETPITTWDVVQREPLTLTPSILCRTCGNHGHITDGKWVKA
jgi:hypothetical protein